MPLAEMFPPVVFLQTSDPDMYHDMFMESSKTIRAYCRPRGYGYEGYIGIKRGRKPWQATYNRIFMYEELILRGFRGWAIYVDADALVLDQTYDLDRLLAEHAEKVAIMTPAGEDQAWWDVNAGVLMMNLRKVGARGLIGLWRRLLESAPADLVANAEPWAPPGLDDQSLLQIALRRRPHLRSRIHLADIDVINSHRASFIRQYLRPLGGIELRTAAIRDTVRQVLNPGP